MKRRIRVVGIGTGHPDQLTVEAVEALRSVEHLVVGDDGHDVDRVAIREVLLERHLGSVPATTVVEEGAIEQYEAAIDDRPGDVAVLVWGDPSLNDRAIDLVRKIVERGRVATDWDVVPGLSSLQVLAARHRIALHEIGRPVMVTTGEGLRQATAAGAESIVVMMGASIDLEGFEAWDIWWGAHLGTDDERLVGGRVVEVAVEVLTTRIEVRTQVGWVADVYLLRKRPELA